MTMLKKGALLGGLAALIFLAWAGPSFAATIKVTDSDLQPATVSVSRGEVVTWADATMNRNAHVTLDPSDQGGIRMSWTKRGDLQATFEKPGTYKYHAHVGAGEQHPFEIHGQVVVK